MPRGDAEGSEGGASPGAVAAAPYSVVVASSFGRIWTRKPGVQRDGLLTVLQPGGGGPDRGPVFTAAAFSERADTLATADSAGNVFLFHITK